MAILPWVNLPQNRTPDQLGSIGDTLVDAARRKQQQEQQAADLLLRQRTADREDRLTSAQLGNYASEAEARKSEAEMRKAQQKRIDEEEKRKQGLDVATAIPTIRAMLTPGSPTYDPQSAMSLARAHGIDLAATQPTAPVQPQIGPTSVEEGPRETPEIAQQAALERSVRNVPGDASPQAGAAEDQKQIGLAEQERQRFAEANDPEAVQRNKLQGQQYADQVSKFRTAQPTYSGTSPIGPVNIDPNAALESQRFALEENKRKLAPLMNIPGMEKYAPGIQAAIASGAKPEQVNALFTKAIEDSRKDQEKADYSLTAQQQLAHQKEMERIGWANAGARRDTTDRGNNDRVEKEQDKLDSTTVRDENGNPIGYVPTGKGGAQGFATRDADYRRALEQLRALNEDIQQNGDRVFLPEAVKRRNALKHNADIAVATVSPLGKTDEAMKAESASIGGGGALGFNMDALIGANPEALGRKMTELQEQRDRYRKETLIPLREGAPETRQAPGARATVGERLTGAAKKQPGGNPLTRAAGGKPQQASVDDLLKQAGF